MVWAIVSTILCCWPLGIVAIIKASKVHSLWYQGQHAEAQRFADDAKKYANYSAVAGAIIAVLYIILLVAAGEL